MLNNNPGLAVRKQSTNLSTHLSARAASTVESTPPEKRTATCTGRIWCSRWLTPSLKSPATSASAAENSEPDRSVPSLCSTDGNAFVLNPDVETKEFVWSDGKFFTLSSKTQFSWSDCSLAGTVTDKFVMPETSSSDAGNNSNVPAEALSWKSSQCCFFNDMKLKASQVELLALQPCRLIEHSPLSPRWWGRGKLCTRFITAFCSTSMSWVTKLASSPFLSMFCRTWTRSHPSQTLPVTSNKPSLSGISQFKTGIHDQRGRSECRLTVM